MQDGIDENENLPTEEVNIILWQICRWLKQ